MLELVRHMDIDSTQPSRLTVDSDTNLKNIADGCL